MILYQVCAHVYGQSTKELDWRPCFATLAEAMSYVEDKDDEEIAGWKEGINNDDDSLMSHWSTVINDGYDSYIIWELTI